MKEKLSNAEIEERKKQNILESAKINSCISGIPLSHIIQSDVHRGNYSKNYCLIKQMFLKNLADPCSSGELYGNLKRQGYDKKYSTFRGLLKRYQKYGYVVKLNDKKPFIYLLTDLGRQHINNPYLAVDELAQKRMNFIYDKFRELISESPEKFKTIYEFVIGSGVSGVSGAPLGSVGSVGTQYPSNNLGSEELKQELNNKIFNSDFWKNTDNDKLKLLTNDILNSSLSNDEKEELLIDALAVAVNSHKGSMIINKQYNSNPKSEGERKYYFILVNSINKPVTRSVYEAIPFRFIRVGSEIRLKSISESGTYKNNQDATILDFDFVKKTYFNNQMIIKTQRDDQKRELEFYYVGGYKNFKITTMSFADYQKAANKSRKQSVTINIQKD
ncbi:hypothetical protein [Methanosarcina mazei]|uniref:hypothetical protein n=1 Tax=Methanosarcina mazei TaxID=2209 RepID=UPI003C792299